MYRVFTALMLGIPVIALFVFFISFRYGKNIRETTASVIHTQEVISKLKEIVILSLQNRLAARDFVNTGEENNIISLPANNVRILSLIREVDSLQGNDIIHLENVDSLKYFVEKRIAFSNELIRLYKDGKKDEAKTLLETRIGKAYTDSIQQKALGLERKELEHLAGHKIKYINGVFYLRTILISVISVVFIAGIFIVRRLRREVFSHIKSEEKFRALLESAPDATIITNEKGEIVMVNNQGVKLFGYTKEEITGMPVEKLIPHAQRDNHKGLRDKFSKAPTERQMGGAGREMQILRKDGTLVPVEISLSPIKTTEGLLVSAAIRDISSRKAAQAQMELMFHQINEAHEAIYIIDGDMIIQSWNRGAELLYGYRREEAIGKKSIELLYTQLNDTEYDDAYKVMTENGYWAGDVKRKKKGGEELIVYSSLTSIRDTSGKVSGYVSVSYDVTENKKLSEQVNFLATVVEQSAEAIVSFDESNRILSWNKGAEKMFGYTKDEMIGYGHKSSNVRFNLSAEVLKERMAELEKNTYISGELVFTRKNGNSFFASVAGNIIYDDSGKIVARVYFVRDISKRKELEAQLRKTNEELEYRVEERTAQIKRSEEQYRLMFRNNPMPMWVLDPETFYFLDANEAATSLYGYTKEEFLKMKAVDMRPDEDKVKFLSPEHRQEMNTTASSRGVWRHLKKNGELITVEVIAYSSIYEGKRARLIMINDITEVKKAEAKLLDSEKRFRAIIESNNDIVALMDAEAKVIYRSPSAYRISGWTNEEFSVKGFLIEIMHFDDRERFLRLFADVKTRPGVPINTTYRIRHKDGHYLDLEVVLTNLLNDEHINAIVLNVRDVTKRKLAEDRLMRSEMRFRSLIENNSDVIGLLDESGKFTYGSPSATRVTGWTADEYSRPGFLGKSVHPDDLQRILGLLNDVKMNPGKSIETYCRILHKNGYYIYIEGTMTNLLNAEYIRAIVFNYRDVTERKEATDLMEKNEKRFRSMIENSYDIVVLMDESFRIIYRSPSAIRMTGNSDEEVLNKSALEKIHPDDIPELTAKMKDLLTNPGGGGYAQFRYLDNKGQYLWMEGTATNLLHEEAVKAIVFNYRNVTERIESEKLIRDSEERYRTTLDNMIEGVQIIGHDWRYKYVNNSVAKHARMKKEDLLGYTMMEKFPGIEHSGVYRAIKKCLADSIPVSMDNEFPYPDGTVSWFQLSIQPVPEGVFILSVDITERIVAEQNLKEEKDKLASIALSAPGLIYSFRLKPDGSLGFPYVSTAVEEVFGLSHEVLKDNIEVIIDKTVEEDKDLLMNSISESARTLSPWNLEFRYHHPEKGMLWLEGNSIPAKETDGSIVWYGVIMDVTERKAAEARINEQRAQLKTLSDNLPGLMIYQITGTSFADRRFTYLGNDITRITGRTPQEVMDDPSLLYKCISSEDLPRMLKEEKEAYDNFSVFNIEIRCRTYKGELRWLNLVSVPRKTDSGQMIWDGFHVDITERKKNQEEIKQSNERFEMVAKATKDVVWDLNPETNEIWWNENYFSIFGYEKEEANNLTTSWEKRIHPEDRERVVSNFDSFIKKGEPYWKDEYRFLKKNGEVAYIYDCGYILYDKKGKPYRVVGSMIDISEITEAQRELKESLDENLLLTGRLSTILNTLPAHIALLDANGIIVDVNEEWKKFTKGINISGDNYGIGENYLEFSGGSLEGHNDKQLVSGEIMKVLKNGKEEFVHEYLCPLCEKTRWFRMVVTPLKGKGNNGAVVMHIDISEIKRMEEERIKSKTEEQRKITEAMLQGQEKERNAIGIELHDNVNQILVGTKVLLSVVRDFPDKREELVPSCIDNINLAIQENRKIAHELVTPNLSNEDLVKQIQRLGDTMLGNAGIKAHIRHDHFNEDLLSNDMKLAVYRVAQEQCTNIIKYAEAEHVIFSLKTSEENFFMRITDDGKGMDKEKVTHGIGLKNMASRLGVFGGTINVETEPGEGFTLEIEIPFVNGAAKPEEE